MPKFAIVLALFAGLSLAFQPLVARADDSHAGPIKPRILEHLDNPPGVPAQAVPGSPPSPAVLYGHTKSIQVNTGPGGVNIPGDAANEPTIAIDPTSPLHMVISWRQFNTVTSNFRQAGWGYTTNEGRTWTFPGVLTPGIFRSNPVLSYDTKGNIYWNSLKEDFTTDVFTSTDDGVTWGNPVPAWGGDKQWMTCDLTSGIGHGNLYSFWTADPEDFTRSTNGGNSFGTQDLIPDQPQWGTMAVAADGTLYIFGIDPSGYYVVAKSTNAKDPSQTPTFTTKQVDLGGYLDGFGGPNPDGLLGQPWIAVDPTNGWIYVAGSVQPTTGSDPLDIHFIRSTDGGNTWSAPVRVNDDPDQTSWQWFGTMSVAPNGRIDIVWNDTRNTGLQNKSALFYSYSTNGGTTWSTNQQLSPVWDSWVGWPNQDKIGDYYCMLSDRVGASLAWAATFNNEQDVYFTRIGDYDCNGNGVPDSLDIANGTSQDNNHNGIPDECEGLASAPEAHNVLTPAMSNSPNPFRGSTQIQFEMPQAGGRASVLIFNAGGQLVRTLLDSAVQGGHNQVVWDGKDDRGRSAPDGMYLYQLTANGIREARQAVLLR